MNYPFNSAIIMTDLIYRQYGGNPDSSSPLQRAAAYLMAEMTATEDLDTFLMPVIVTGTYLFNPIQMRNDVNLKRHRHTRALDAKLPDPGGGFFEEMNLKGKKDSVPPHPSEGVVVDDGAQAVADWISNHAVEFRPGINHNNLGFLQCSVRVCRGDFF